MKTYDLTTQMKALCLYFHICFSKFYKMKFENLVEICLWLRLAVKGLRVKTLSNTNLLASRHVKREKSSLPLYVRRSKTSLPKRLNDPVDSASDV